MYYVIYWLRVVPTRYKSQREMGFLSGQYRFPTLWYLTMPVTPHFICIPAAVVIFIALVLSIMTSLSLPVIDALPIVQTTFNNGSLVISKTNATYNASNLQNVEEIKVRFLSFSFLVASHWFLSLFQFGIWWDVHCQGMTNKILIYTYRTSCYYYDGDRTCLPSKSSMPLFLFSSTLAWL